MELNQLETTLKMIPGCPQDVEVIGRGPDRIKLSWNPPAHNPEAAELYVVSMRVEGGAWEEVKRAKHTKALVTGLKSKKKYEFKVTATNSVMISLENVEESETKSSKVARAAGGVAAGVVGGVVAVPFIFAALAICGILGKDKFGNYKWNTATKLGTGIATIPLSLILSPVSVPVLSVYAAHNQMKKCNVGDLTPTSEDEEQ